MGKILIVIGFVILLAGLGFLFHYMKKEREAERKQAGSVERELKKELNEQKEEIVRALKNTRRSVKQYVKSKTKRAIKELKSGKLKLQEK